MTVINTGGGGGWGPGYWGDASYPYPVVVEPVCDVTDAQGRCAIYDANGNIIGFQGIGDDAVVPAPAAPAEAQMGSATSWVTGGLLVGLAVIVFAIDSKNILNFK